MSTVNTRVTNGVSMGYLHTVVAEDISDGEVIIDFQTPYNLVASVMITEPASPDPTQSAPIVDMGDAEISYPAEGQVKIADGDSIFKLIVGQLIHVVAQRRSALDS